MTLSSVGYGDLVPETPLVKLFTAAYIIVGVGILATALGEAVSGLLISDDEETTALDRVSTLLLGSESEAAADGAGGSLRAGLTPAAWQVAQAASSVLLLLGLGTLTFAKLEGKGLVDSLFYSVVTVTTVGYGDTVPLSTEGKVCSTCVVSAGRAAQRTTSLPCAASRAGCGRVIGLAPPLLLALTSLGLHEKAKRTLILRGRY